VKNKDSRLELVQAMGILFVVLGHSYPSLSYTFENPYLESIVYGFYKFIYNFHMPLFFFISGHLFFSKADFSFKYVSKRFSKLIIPYLSIYSLSFLFKAMFSQFSLRNFELSWQGFLNGIFFPWEGPNIYLWYLPTLFIVSLVALFAAKYCKGNYLTLFIIVLMTLNFWFLEFTKGGFLNFYGVAYYLPFFILGGYKKVLESHISLLFFLGAFVILNHLEVAYLIDLSFSLAMISLIFICARIINYKGGGIVSKLAFYSFQIYLLSWFFQVFTRILMFNTTDFSFVLSMIFMCITGILCPIFIVKMIKKYTFNQVLPKIIGLP
jgi:hypothetical protein